MRDLLSSRRRRSRANSEDLGLLTQLGMEEAIQLQQQKRQQEKKQSVSSPLSIIAPHEWNMEHVISVRLNSDSVWKKIQINSK
jgi:hypothetical protein